MTDGVPGSVDIHSDEEDFTLLEESPPEEISKDSFAKREEARIDAAAKLEHDERVLDMNQRKDFALKTYWIVVFWLITVVVLLALGMCEASRMRPLPESVQVALVAGSTVNIVALFAAVLGYLFPKGGRRR